MKFGFTTQFVTLRPVLVAVSMNNNQIFIVSESRPILCDVSWFWNVGNTLYAHLP